MKTPPLVTPGPALTVDEVRRYSRHLIIPDVAMAGQQRMMNAKVLCVGAGGLGSPALMYLAAAGIGTLGPADGFAWDIGTSPCPGLADPEPRVVAGSLPIFQNSRTENCILSGHFRRQPHNFVSE
jgi:hypothetical protein